MLNMTEPRNWPTGLKKTRQRLAVLEVLESTRELLTVSEICARLDASEGTPSISTVYRVLDLFEKKGVVVKTNAISGDTAVYALNRFEHRHYAICVACKKIIAMDNCPMESFVPSLADEGFHVVGHDLQIMGFCRECDQKRGG